MVIDREAGSRAALAEQGRRSIDRAAAGMPVLALLQAERISGRPLAGHRIAGSVQLTKETAVLVRALAGAGAEVAWTSGDEVSTQDDVAAAVAAEGVQVFAHARMTTDEVQRAIGSVLDAFGQPPTLLVDNGGQLIASALERPAAYHSAIGAATEKTSVGVHRLRPLAAAGRLPFPVVAIDEALTKQIVDSTHGTGQSTIDGILRATGMLLAGKVFVIVGYGHVGPGVAFRARGLGARVVVCCRSARTAVRARLAGFSVRPMDEAAEIGDVFCTATGRDGVIDGGHLDRMKDGAVLCNVGHSVTEIDLEALAARAVAVEDVRPHMTQYRLRDGRRLMLLAGGGLVNLGAAEGNASEVMDVTFAHQLLAIMRLAGGGAGLAPGLHRVSEEEEERVAALKLAAMGIRHDAVGGD
jgi:adenosylhomocysteinase